MFLYSLWKIHGLKTLINSSPNICYCCVLVLILSTCTVCSSVTHTGSSTLPVEFWLLEGHKEFPLVPLFHTGKQDTASPNRKKRVDSEPNTSNYGPEAWIQVAPNITCFNIELCFFMDFYSHKTKGSHNAKHLPNIWVGTVWMPVMARQGQLSDRLQTSSGDILALGLWKLTVC